MSTRRTRDDRRQILRRFVERDFSIRAFARREGLCYESRKWRRWKLGSLDKGAQPAGCLHRTHGS
jgi:transposase-like protein